MEAAGSMILAGLQILSTIFFGGMAYQMLREHGRRIGVLEKWKEQAAADLNKMLGAREMGAD